MAIGKRTFDYGTWKYLNRAVLSFMDDTASIKRLLKVPLTVFVLLQPHCTRDVQYGRCTIPETSFRLQVLQPNSFQFFIRC